MWSIIRSTFLASIILFGASAAYALDDFGQEIEDVEEGACGGDIEPLCRTRTRETCTDWDPCAPLVFCCMQWKKTTVYDYYRDPADEWGIYY